jgi:hypothetical protein
MDIYNRCIKRVFEVQLPLTADRWNSACRGHVVEPVASGNVADSSVSKRIRREV